jgi:hypothetical protein
MRQFVFAAVLALGLFQAASVFATPSPFTPGDLVIYRVGKTDGQAMKGSGNTVFLDEYAPAGGAPIQSYQFNDNNGTSAALIAQGTASADGFLTRSANGPYLSVPGYNASLGSLSTTTSDRMIARVGADGTLNLATSITNLATAGTGQFRGAVSNDGNQFWMITQNNGVYTVPLGGTTATQVSTDFTGRTINIFGGQLYASGSTKTVAQIGTGLPTASGQSVTPLAGETGAYNFYMADLSSAVPGLDTLYYADDTANEVKKFSLVGGTWTQTGAITTGGAAKGLAGQTNGTTVSLYITAGSTSGNGTGSLSMFTDATGYQGTVTGAGALITTTTGANAKYQGIAFAPAPQMSISTTAGPVSRGVATKDVVFDLGGAQPVGFNNGQVQIVAQTDSSVNVLLDIERGDAATSGATPAASEIADLVTHLNDPANQFYGKYVAVDLVANPGAVTNPLPDGDFEVLLTFNAINGAAAQYLNFDMLQDTGLDIDRIFVTAVPEPSAIAGLLISSTMLLSRRRKRIAA